MIILMSLVKGCCQNGAKRPQILNFMLCFLHYVIIIINLKRREMYSLQMQQQHDATEDIQSFDVQCSAVRSPQSLFKNSTEISIARLKSTSPFSLESDDTYEDKLCSDLTERRQTTPEQSDQSYASSECIIEEQQKAESLKFKKLIKDEAKLNSYYRGHLIYLTQDKYTVFGRSRRYQRSKKRNIISQLECIRESLVPKEHKKKGARYVKRFDQVLHNKYKELPIQKQEEEDLTPSSLNNIIERGEESANGEVLRRFLEKYNSERYLVKFAMNFAKSKTNYQKRSLLE